GACAGAGPVGGAPVSAAGPAGSPAVNVATHVVLNTIDPGEPVMLPELWLNAPSVTVSVRPASASVPVFVNEPVLPLTVRSPVVQVMVPLFANDALAPLWVTFRSAARLMLLLSGGGGRAWVGGGAGSRVAGPWWARWGGGVPAPPVPGTLWTMPSEAFTSVPLDTVSVDVKPPVPFNSIVPWLVN